MKSYRVKPGKRISIKDWDPKERSGFMGDKQASEKQLAEYTGQLESLQEILYAEHKHKLLIVLQGMDTSGKDGVIRRVFEGVNPQGVRVASFKVPTAEELSHDFLWRVSKQVPASGEIVIFNRSHYEDVLVVRVHDLVPPKIWGARYKAINDFERNLAEEGTTILKFFLHIDKEEQKERLQERLDEPTKQWKFDAGDLKERALWREYMEAYEQVMNETSTDWAPWYIVPANRKWYRNLVISGIIVETLQSLKMAYPKPKEDLSGIKIE
jgi:PPK2 family polyphosphate:nucleotide phosphotransferase